MKTGDAVHAILNPAAKTIDAIWGTDLQTCSGCAKMQTNLNNAKTAWDFYDAIVQRFKHQPKETNHADTRN
jgi:hypothetical protein